MNGIEEFEEVHTPNNHADDEDHPSELIAELVDLLLQRSVLLIILSGLNFGVYRSDSGLHSSSSDNTPGSSLLHIGG